MEIFVKIDEGCFRKKNPILVIWLGSKYVSALGEVFLFS